LAPYQTRDGSVAAIAGPDIDLRGSAVTSFALLLREFAPTLPSMAVSKWLTGISASPALKTKRIFNLMQTEHNPASRRRRLVSSVNYTEC